jgi:hypothetical protein
MNHIRQSKLHSQIKIDKAPMPWWVLGWSGFITQNTHVEYEGLTIKDGYEWYEYMWEKWLQNSDLGRQYLKDLK